MARDENQTGLPKIINILKMKTVLVATSPPFLKIKKEINKLGSNKLYNDLEKRFELKPQDLTHTLNPS